MESMKGRRSFLKALIAAPVVMAAAPAIAEKMSNAPVQHTPLPDTLFAFDAVTLDGVSYPIAAGSKLNLTVTAEKFESGIYARYSNGVIRGPGPDGKVMNFFPAFSPPVAITGTHKDVS